MYIRKEDQIPWWVIWVVNLLPFQWIVEIAVMLDRPSTTLETVEFWPSLNFAGIGPRQESEKKKCTNLLCYVWMNVLWHDTEPKVYSPRTKWGSWNQTPVSAQTPYSAKELFASEGQVPRVMTCSVSHSTEWSECSFISKKLSCPMRGQWDPRLCKEHSRMRLLL